MDESELDILNRAHRLFAANTGHATTDARSSRHLQLPGRAAEMNIGGGQERYRVAVQAQRDALRATAATDAAVGDVIAAARDGHALARERTGQVVEEARAAETVVMDTPLAQREVMRARAARLRAQRAHVLAARQQALRQRAALRRLRYPSGRRRVGSAVGLRLSPTGGRAGRAVRAALSRLGRPYVWGATGPDRFDCSGLTQWAYGQAGVHLDRTTYQQIHAGIAVPPAQIRAGDLVFPSTGHVQLAIGDGLVVEAPHAGATVQISPLGSYLAIRRPLP